MVSALIVLGASACGGDGDDSEAARTTTTAQPTTTNAPPIDGQAPPTVPPPGGGSIDETAPSGADPGTAAPVSFDATASFGDGVEVRIAEMTAIEGEAQIPGERSGPAVSITLEALNNGTQPVSLDTTTVDLTDADGMSASSISGTSAPLAGSLAPGQHATGTYVFTVPAAERADARLTVKYSAATPTVVFTGSLPGA